MISDRTSPPPASASRLPSSREQLISFIRKSWLESISGLIALSAIFYVIVYPFTVVRYPPMTDLPMHASNMSIVRHYLDTEFQFQNQFTLHPFEAPYFSMYAIGALFATALSVPWAAKSMAIVMLMSLPLGLAILFHGMKKSPWWAIASLGLVWNTLTHWGFLSYLAAIGIFAAVIGLTLLVLDRPTRSRQLALAGALVFLFFTHIYRFPFAIFAMGLTAVTFYPVTKKIRPLLWPMMPGLGLFGIWLFIRPHVLSPGIPSLTFDLSRLEEMNEHLFGGFQGEVGARETAFGQQALVAVLGISILSFFLNRKKSLPSEPSRYWNIAVTLLPLGLAALFLFAYLSLPLTEGSWFFIYPRELTTAAYLSLAALPDLSRARWVRVPALLVIGLMAARTSSLTTQQWRAFENLTTDFQEIKKEIPQTPKLLHLVYDHSGTQRTTTPFIHLPAWIQAEQGGALNFHFARWALYPIRYRRNSDSVPPQFPHFFEWHPEWFKVLEHGLWFDTFLVRHSINPDQLFHGDPSIHRVAQSGTWWLYRRTHSRPPSSGQ